MPDAILAALHAVLTLEVAVAVLFLVAVLLYRED